MLILMLLMEGIVLCFILLMFCVIGIANGPEKFTVFYDFTKRMFKKKQ